MVSAPPAPAASAVAMSPPPGPYSSITGSISAARFVPNAGGVTVMVAPAGAAPTSKANQS